MSDWKRVENPAPDGRSKPASATPPEKPAQNPPRPAASAVPARREPSPASSRETDSVQGLPSMPAESLFGQEEVLPAAAPEKPEYPAEEPGGSDGIVALSAGLSMPETDGNEPIRSPRYTKHGRRKGRLWYAAPLGFLVLVLAVVGVVSLILTGINAIQKAQDDTELRKELNDFLLPVMQYCPSPFTAVNDEQQDALLLAAIWRITTAEQVRQYREDDTNSLYPEDEEYRMMIPIEEIEASYRYLYGPDAVPNHHNIEEESQGFAFEYDPDNACYHVPFTTVSANYVPVLDTLKRRKDTVTVRVAYVSNKDVALDDYGNEIPPTPDQATYTQIYTVVKTADGWALTSIAQET